MKLSSTLVALSLGFASACAVAQTNAPAGPAPATLDDRTVAANEAAGQAAALAWLTQLDRGMWGEAWDQSSRVFRTNVPLGTWMDNVPKTRGILGAAKERKVGEIIFRTELAGQPAGAYVSVLYVSQFPGKEPMEEIVTTVREPDGRWRVTGYSTR
ncbi:MAG: DUF4019 domain-containing protein [Bdellovibrionales bacterium]|nr:DUF4019 domain-containing protein [Ramlibacter sp.]